MFPFKNNAENLKVSGGGNAAIDTDGRTLAGRKWPRYRPPLMAIRHTTMPIQ